MDGAPHVGAESLLGRGELGRAGRLRAAHCRAGVQGIEAAHRGDVTGLMLALLEALEDSPAHTAGRRCITRDKWRGAWDGIPIHEPRPRGTGAPGCNGPQRKTHGADSSSKRPTPSRVGETSEPARTGQ